MRVFRAAAVVVVVLLWVAAGCAPRPWWASGRGYTFAFHNTSESAVREVKAEWERGFLSAPGVMPAGAFVPGFFGTNPMPAEATLSWVDAKGDTHSTRVEVARQVPEPGRFGGVMVFRIAPDGHASAVPLSEGEAVRLANSRKQR